MSDFIRDENFTEKQIRGIDLAIKATTKKYPFILGWEFIDNFEKWKSKIYINIFVNWEEVRKFYNQEWSEHWSGDLNKGTEIKSSLIKSYVFKNPSFSDREEYEKWLDDSYDKTKQIEGLINLIYVSLPEEFQITYHIDWGFSEIKPEVVKFSIENFIGNKS